MKARYIMTYDGNDEFRVSEHGDDKKSEILLFIKSDLLGGGTIGFKDGLTFSIYILSGTFDPKEFSTLIIDTKHGAQLVSFETIEQRMKASKLAERL